MKKIKEEESVEMLEVLGLINNLEEYQKIYIHVEEENIGQEFRMKNIDEIRNYLIEEINRNEFMSKKH